MKNIKADGETDAANNKISDASFYALYTSFHEQHSPHLTVPTIHTTHMHAVNTHNKTLTTNPS